MKVALEPGKYVMAVSGGVDSVSLLHALRGLPDIELVAAHFDHGIRDDSLRDRLLVQSLAESYGLPFVYEEGNLGLGAGASEATARQARYDFLEKARRGHGAEAIVTAHHQDDALETAIINLLRGTGRKGLSALGDRPDVRRPLLKIPKRDIIDYARQHGLEWREDSTNGDQAYLRNYVRQRLLPRFGERDKQKFLSLIQQARDNNQALDELLKGQLHGQQALDRRWLIQLPHPAALEVMAAWLRGHGIRDFDSQTLERLVVAAKTAQPGQQFDVLHGATIRAGKDNLALAVAER